MHSQSYSTERAQQSATTAPFNPIVSNELLNAISVSVKGDILLPLAFVGIITNTLNVVIFYRQGFKEGTTISLTAISLWNALKCVCGFITKLSYPVGLISPVLGLTWDSVTFPYLEYTTIYAGYVTFALAAFVSVERFVCVWKPFAAKALITPAITLASVVTISIFTYGAYFVVYFIYAIRFELDRHLNATVAKYTFSQFYYSQGGTVMVYYQIVGILIPTLSFLIMCISFVGTIFYLRQTTKFLRQGPSSIKRVSVREKQVSKTLLTLITIYIINLFPRIVFYIAQLAESEFYTLRKYHNLFISIATFLFVLDFSNAFIQFFVFMKMSSVFRRHFCKLFGY